MANNIYTLGALTEAAAKSASRFIRDGVRNGGYSGLVDVTAHVHTTSPSVSNEDDSLPKIALYTKSADGTSALLDIQTGLAVEGTYTVSLPTVALTTNSMGSFSTVVFLGQTNFLQEVSL